MYVQPKPVGYADRAIWRTGGSESTQENFLRHGADLIVVGEGRNDAGHLYDVYRNAEQVSGTSELATGIDGCITLDDRGELRPIAGAPAPPRPGRTAGSRATSDPIDAIPGCLAIPSRLQRHLGEYHARMSVYLQSGAAGPYMARPTGGAVPGKSWMNWHNETALRLRHHLVCGRRVRSVIAGWKDLGTRW